MKFTQSHTFITPSTLEIGFKESGFSYKFEDKGFFGQKRIDESFVYYHEIGNHKEYKTRVNPFSKSMYISISLISIVIYSIIIFSFFSGKVIGSSYEAPLFYAPILLAFLLYKLFAKQKVLLLKGNATYITVFNDASGDKIVKEIYSRRNQYLRNKIFNVMRGVASIDTIEFLSTLGAISDAEVTELKSKNSSSGDNKKIGFK